MQHFITLLLGPVTVLLKYDGSTSGGMTCYCKAILATLVDCASKHTVQSTEPRHTLFSMLYVHMQIWTHQTKVHISSDLMSTHCVSVLHTGLPQWWILCRIWFIPTLNSCWCRNVSASWTRLMWGAVNCWFLSPVALMNLSSAAGSSLPEVVLMRAIFIRAFDGCCKCTCKVGFKIFRIDWP